MIGFIRIYLVFRNTAARPLSYKLAHTLTETKHG